MKAQLLSYLLEASICFEVLYVFYWLALQKLTFFVVSRVYLLAMATAAWIIPLLAFEPDNLVFVDDQVFASIPHTISVVEQPVRIASGSFVWSDAVLWVYVAGAVILAGRFAWRLGKLYLLLRRSNIHWMETHQRIDTEGKLPTFSFLDYLFWDNTTQLTESEKEQVFQHELVHIRERHSWDILYAELLKVAFWINPAVYLFKNELHLLHEYRADALTARLYGTEVYTDTLLDTLFRKLQLTFSHSFNQCSIQMRTTMLQKTHSSPRRLWALLFALPLVSVLLFAFTLKEQPLVLSELTGFSVSNDTISSKAKIFHQFLKNNQPVTSDWKANGLSLSDFPDVLQLEAKSIDPSSDAGSRYEVRDFIVYLVNGSRPLASVRSQTGVIKMEGLKNASKTATSPSLRLVIEITEVIRINSKGEESRSAVMGSPIISVSVHE